MTSRHPLRAFSLLCIAVTTGGSVLPALAQPVPATATAIFAGGCFWCIEKDFEQLPGVIDVESGYTGGKTERPTYE